MEYGYFASDELPLGLGMALAQNNAAMENFAALSSAGKQAVLEKARSVKSKQEMSALVDSLAYSNLYSGIG